ncbi:hypothetical protein KFU94_21745 [Chloroflexi bacterium TSY]|nr:hypothetical protein [Chloroflexi bacterium TSY]
MDTHVAHPGGFLQHNLILCWYHATCNTQHASLFLKRSNLMDVDERFTAKTLEELELRWEREEITLEQLNGRMLIWIGHLHRLLVASQREQESIARTLADLDARIVGLEGSTRESGRTG